MDSDKDLLNPSNYPIIQNNKTQQNNKDRNNTISNKIKNNKISLMDIKNEIRNIKINKEDLLKDVITFSNITFRDFGLKTKLIEGLNNINFIYPSIIQEKTIPIILEKQDLLAQSKNGSGKTAAFVIPILHMIDEKINNTQAIILVPTKELLLQTFNIIKSISKYMNITYSYITGGDNLTTESYQNSLTLKVNNNNYSNEHVIVATPGKLLNKIERKLINLENLKMIVIDEVDKLLNRGSLNITTTKIIEILNKQNNKQLIAFSSTYPKETIMFLKRYCKKSSIINCTKQIPFYGITQFYKILNNEDEKIKELVDIFQKIEIKQCIVFCQSPEIIYELSNKLKSKYKINTLSTYGQLSFEERKQIFKDFINEKSKILLTTNILSRGINIENLTLVINYDLPLTYEDYLHRVGRSGRFGKFGLAINFVLNDQLVNIEKIIKFYNIHILKYNKTEDIINQISKIRN